MGARPSLDRRRSGGGSNATALSCARGWAFPAHHQYTPSRPEAQPSPPVGSSDAECEPVPKRGAVLLLQLRAATSGRGTIAEESRGRFAVDGGERVESAGEGAADKRGSLGAREVPSPEEVERLTPRALLRRLGLTARKGLSQSFLTDRYVVKDIITAAELTPSDEVLEVGPGLGVLTRELVRVAGRVVAVELDRRLAELLPRLVPNPERLEVYQGDILDFDPAVAFRGSYKVVANLPYHVTSPALRHLLGARRRPELMVVMVQKEVAERIAAKPGDTSLISIMVQLYARVRVVRQVPAESFYPAPKVDSTVLKLEVYDRLPPEVDDPQAFLGFVAAGFSRRRKQIHNSLSESLWFPPGGVFDVLREAGIEPTRRAQTLSMEEWLRLYRAYQDARRRWQEGERA